MTDARDAVHLDVVLEALSFERRRPDATIESAPGPSVPPEGPTEAVRKTLAFHLVSELFELSRG